MASAVLLPPDFDNHLLEAGHDCRGTKVAEVGHAIAGAQCEGGIAWVVST